MSVYDESGEYESVACPFCHVEAEESCDHLLALADITFGEMNGQMAVSIDEFETLILDTFREKLASGKKPKWANLIVESLWETLLESDISDPEELSLPTKSFYDLVLSFLYAAGGWEHPGDLLADSGGRCTSAIRLMYAENPEKVVADVIKMLPGELAEDPPKPRRRRKKKL